MNLKHPDESAPSTPTGDFCAWGKTAENREEVKFLEGPQMLIYSSSPTAPMKPWERFGAAF